VTLSRLALSSCLLLAACAPAPPRLVVQLVTDYAPARDFDSIRVTGPGHDVSVDVLGDRSYGRAVRVAELELASAERVTISLALFLGDTLVQMQPRRVTPIAGSTSFVTFLITRDCAGVMCPDAAEADAIACIGGRCANPECSAEHLELCPSPCPGGCTASPIACVESTCRPEGVCFDEAQDDRCAMGEVCVADEGCRDLSVPSDAAVVPPDAGADAFTPDAFARDAFVPDAFTPDAGPPDPLVVINTLAAGPGSLADAVDYVNANCAVLVTPTITFDIPATDPGFVTAGTGHVWRIEAPLMLSLSCATMAIDGTTQTVLHGDTNPVTFGGVPVGAAAVPLPVIQGPEIELRGVAILLFAASISIRGLAVASVNVDGASVIVEQCVVGSEPDSLTPLPGALLASPAYVFYAQNCADSIFRENVYVESVTTGAYNGFSMRAGCDRGTVRDSYFTGNGPGIGDIWDELHLNPATDHRVIHNWIGGAAWQVHIEWVTGTLGTMTENTFAGVVPMIGSGAATTTSGNLMVP
jgi:hypothetical protein